MNNKGRIAIDAGVLLTPSKRFAPGRGTKSAKPASRSRKTARRKSSAETSSNTGALGLLSKLSPF